MLLFEGMVLFFYDKKEYEYIKKCRSKGDINPKRNTIVDIRSKKRDRKKKGKK
jgi:hypothetical protein